MLSEHRYGADSGHVIDVPQVVLVQEPSGHLFLPNKHYDETHYYTFSLQVPSSQRTGVSSGQL